MTILIQSPTAIYRIIRLTGDTTNGLERSQRCQQLRLAWSATSWQMRVSSWHVLTLKSDRDAIRSSSSWVAEEALGAGEGTCFCWLVTVYLVVTVVSRGCCWRAEWCCCCWGLLPKKQRSYIWAKWLIGGMDKWQQLTPCLLWERERKGATKTGRNKAETVA